MGDLYTYHNFAIAFVSSINQPMQTTSTSTVKYRYYQGNTPYYTNGSWISKNFNGASTFSFPVGKNINGTRA